MKNLTTCFSLVILIGCANPLHRETYREYTEIGDMALLHYNYAVAEEAYGRALRNAEWGALSDAEKSGSLFNLANVKLRLRKYAEAKPLLQRSLALEETLHPPSHPFVVKRHQALAIVCFETDDKEVGLKHLLLSLPYEADAQLVAAYSAWLESSGRHEEAEALRNVDL